MSDDDISGGLLIPLTIEADTCPGGMTFHALNGYGELLLVRSTDNADEMERFARDDGEWCLIVNETPVLVVLAYDGDTGILESGLMIMQADVTVEMGVNEE